MSEAQRLKGSSRVLIGSMGVSLLFLVLGWIGCAALPAQSASAGGRQGGVELNLNEGQTAKVPGTGLTIEARKVRDFTSAGCLGGPVGCPDQVHLKVTHNNESKEITLYFAHTQLQRDQRVNRSDVFGYTIALTGLRGKQLTLIIK